MNFLKLLVGGIAMLCFSTLAQAQSLDGPHVAGYRSSNGDSSESPEAIGKIVCTINNNGTRDWSFDHVVALPDPGVAHPRMEVRCTWTYYPPGGGTPVKYVPFGGYIDWQDTCVEGDTPWPDKDGRCPAAPKPPQTCQPPEGKHPINMATKEKYRIETDYGSAQGLEFSRHYSNRRIQAFTGRPFDGWYHSYTKKILATIDMQLDVRYGTVYHWENGRWQPDPVPPSTSSSSTAHLLRPDGHRIYFLSTDRGGSWQADGDINYQLSSKTDGSGKTQEWNLRTPQDDTEIYDQQGRLTSIRFHNGRWQKMTYSDASTPLDVAPSAGLLLQVTDNFGKSLALRYDALGRLAQMTDPAGQATLYAYDAAGDLVSVTYPDGLRRQYVYSEPEFQPSPEPMFAHLLTGIVDETSPGNLVRYATFKYDLGGNPVSSELAGGADKTTFDYPGNAYTDALGARRVKSFTTVNGVKLPYSVSQPGGAGCGAAYTQISYDANGNKTADTDFIGNRTTYVYDARNLETSRVESAGKPEARTISTAWHPGFRLPSAIAEPRRITRFVYDANGNLLGKSVQATLDESGGLGFAAKPAGAARVRTFAYDVFGKILSAAGPRADQLDVTKYQYDAQGNLISVANAAGHVTTLSHYDAHGHVGKITDPNGLVTSLGYHPRGWLASRTTGGETTRYEYQGGGQLKTVTLPDGGTVNYRYDDAHRLIGIADSLGNTIAYTLDGKGNRVKEQVSDPSGSLTRQTARVFDVLGRMQQITGGMQ